MSKIHFNHQQKKRKTWLLPLIVIILLYISIPFLLIQSGDETIKAAISKTENHKLEVPSKEYSKAVVFLQIAEAFPGFTTWSKQIQQSSNKKMLNIYQLKCQQKGTKLFIQLNDNPVEYDSLLVSFESVEESLSLNATIYSKGEKENLKVVLPDELSKELKIEFCDVWRKFFEDYKIDIPKNNSICK
ncbi:MAG: hypothetical protein DRI95_13385 [Bacteroidetes bacterium]|nr:MAG: hypothetical protein DRI95_13385 [Bacteroidota bacterium]